VRQCLCPKRDYFESGLDAPTAYPNCTLREIGWMNSRLDEIEKNSRLPTYNKTDIKAHLAAIGVKTIGRVSF